MSATCRPQKRAFNSNADDDEFPIGSSRSNDSGSIRINNNTASQGSKNLTYPLMMGSAHRCQSLLHAFDDIVTDTDNIPAFLHAHKTTLRFPEMLLFLLVQAERAAAESGHRRTESVCIGWNLNGQAIIIRNRDELVNKVLPVIFPKSNKFSSFTRKLYRWGFRQVGNITDADTSQNTPKTTTRSRDTVFFHPLFQRDNKALAANMSSTTAEGVRRAMASKNLRPSSTHEESSEFVHAAISRPNCLEQDEAVRLDSKPDYFSADASGLSFSQLRSMEPYTMMPTYSPQRPLLDPYYPSLERENVIASSFANINRPHCTPPLLSTIIGTQTAASCTTHNTDSSTNTVPSYSLMLLSSFHQPSSLLMVSDDQLVSLRQIITAGPRHHHHIHRAPEITAIVPRDFISPSY